MPGGGSIDIRRLLAGDFISLTEQYKSMYI